MAAPKLTKRLQTIFEEHGVIPTPTVPKLQVLQEACRARAMSLELVSPQEGAVMATVVSKGQRFYGDSPDASLAVSEALAAALVATAPRQAGLFDAGVADDDDLNDDGDDADEEA